MPITTSSSGSGGGGGRLNRFDASDQRRTPFDDRFPVHREVANHGRREKIAGVNARQSERLIQAHRDQSARWQGAHMRQGSKRCCGGSTIAGKMIGREAFGGNGWPPAVIGQMVGYWMKREALVACGGTGASVSPTQGIRSSASLVQGQVQAEAQAKKYPR